MSRNAAPPSLAARLAVAAFGLLSLLGGWLVVEAGGFFHAPGKSAAGATFYTGAPAVLMATLQFLAAALALTWLLRSRWPLLPALALALGLVFVPPALVLLAR